MARQSKISLLRDETRAFLSRINTSRNVEGKLLDPLNYVREIKLIDSADGAVTLHVEFYVDPQFMDGK